MVTTTDVSLDILMDGAAQEHDHRDEGERIGDSSALRDARVSPLLRVRPAMVVYGKPKAALLTALASAVCAGPVRVHVLHGLRLETVTGPGRRVLLWLERLVAGLSTVTVAVSPSGS